LALFDFCMYFQVLQLRLLATLKEMVRKGDMTERRLARLTGVSQPHMHNVLKGVRILSSEVADEILRHLKISVYDLLDREEVFVAAPDHYADLLPYRDVPVLNGRLGPGHAFPSTHNPVERYPFPASFLSCWHEPVLVRTAQDPEMAHVCRAGDLVLLDRSEQKRTECDRSGLYAICWEGEGLLRRLHAERGCLHVHSVNCALDPPSQKHISLARSNILDIVKGKVVWLGRELEQLRRGPYPVDQAGAANRRHCG